MRLALPVKGAAYDFGTKFGAGPDQAVNLLAQVAASAQARGRVSGFGGRILDGDSNPNAPK